MRPDVGLSAHRHAARFPDARRIALDEVGGRLRREHREAGALGGHGGAHRLVVVEAQAAAVRVEGEGLTVDVEEEEPPAGGDGPLHDGN